MSLYNPPPSTPNTDTLDTVTTRGATTTNAITVGNITDSGITASKVVFTDASKVLTSTGIGTSGQFIKGDGSLDSNAYGTGTVTAVSVASANGLAGTSSGGATPTLTLSTSITGVLKGNGTAISACTNLSDVSYLTATGATVGATSQSQVFTNGATLSNMTLGSALFAGTLGVISQDNANYFYDATNHRLGLGTTSPAQKLHIYDGNIRMEQVQFPIAPTVAVNATAGNLNGVYYYTISFVTATGETQVGSRSSSVSPASQQVNLSSIPISASSDVTARKIYRTVANGDVTNMRLVTTIADNTTTTYTDNIADGSLGAYNPQTNTTGALIFNGTNKVFTADQNTTIIGFGALPNNTQVQNLAIGSYALAANTLGSYNTAIGATALQKNTTGYQNLAIGATALVANVSGYDNTAIGYGTLVNNTSYNNLAVGYSALANNTSGHDNIGIGISTVGNNTGNFNTAIGNNAMVSSGNVSSNTVIGGSSGSFLQGSFNTFIGVNSGQFIYDDSYNIAIGNSAQYPGGRTSESIAIGGSSGVYILNTNSSSMAVAVASGGSVTVGTHHYYYTFYFTDGTELQIGGCINATTSAGNQTVNITNIPTYTGSLAIAGRRLYRSLAGGNTFLSYKLADIADNTTTTYTDTLADGSLGARNPGANYSMCSGYQSSYYFSNQAVFGHQGASAITQVYFGGGVESSAPDSFSLMATSATGTNTAGASITLVGGRSTGSANGGNLVFQTAIPGSSGIVPNGTATRMTISGATGAVSVNNLFFPQQAPTVSAPAYVLGAIYYDTTLSKLRVGGATGWETITSL